MYCSEAKTQLARLKTSLYAAKGEAKLLKSTLYSAFT